MSLAGSQIDALLQPLDPRRIKQANGQSHLEAWDVRRHLLRVFGYGGWSFRVVSCDLILERSAWSDDPKETHKGRHSVAYRVIGALDIFDPERNLIATFEDGATGDALNQPSFGDAHDMALKTAMSQALKRCAINLGDRFGLSLYNGGSAGAVVGKTLGNSHVGEQEADDEVRGGELNEPPAEAPTDTTPSEAASLAERARAMAAKKSSGPDHQSRAAGEHKE